MNINIFDAGRSLRGKIYSLLKENILTGQYKEGDSLVELKLAQELGVSRTPIREALRQLELEGLVISIPNKGVIVQGLSAQDFEDIYTIRTMLESLAARRAVEKISGAELKEMEHILDLTELYTIKEDIEKWLVVDTQFHDIIFKAAKSKPLLNILSSFHQFSIMPRQYSFRVPGRLKLSFAEHLEIFEALKAKDPDRVEKAVVNHLANAEKNMKQMLGSNFKHGQV